VKIKIIIRQKYETLKYYCTQEIVTLREKKLEYQTLKWRYNF